MICVRSALFDGTSVAFSLDLEARESGADSAGWRLRRCSPVLRFFAVGGCVPSSACGRLARAALFFVSAMM